MPRFVFDFIFLKIKFNRAAFFLALSTAVLITLYTLVDGIGVRKAENGFTYIFWLFALNGVPLLVISIFSKKGLRDRNSYTIKSGIAAGFFATSSYALVVWGKYRPGGGGRARTARCCTSGEASLPSLSSRALGRRRASGVACTARQ